MSNHGTQKPHITEENVIDYLNDYFENLRNNLKSNNISHISSRLPVFMVEKFVELFQLWDESRIFGRTVNKKIFESVYSTMSNTFDNHSHETKGNDVLENSILIECKSCGEEIAWRNNNLQYSYDFHKTTPEHLEFLQHFNIEEKNNHEDNNIKNASEVENGEKQYDIENLRIFFSIDNTRCNLCDLKISTSLESHLKSSIHEDNMKIFRCNEKFVKICVTTKGKAFQCTLCPETCSLNELMSHFEGERHYRNEIEKMFVEEFDINCIVVAENGIRCKLCPIKFNCEKDFLDHVNSGKHKSNARSFRLNFKLNVEIREKVLRCGLCNDDERYAEVVDFLKHCKKYKHVKKFNKLLSTTDRSKVNLSFDDNKTPVDVFLAEISCSLCHTLRNGLNSLFIHWEVFHRGKGRDMP